MMLLITLGKLYTMQEFGDGRPSLIRPWFSHCLGETDKLTFEKVAGIAFT